MDRLQPDAGRRYWIREQGTEADIDDIGEFTFIHIRFSTDREPGVILRSAERVRRPHTVGKFR
jgi:hypothetical protein